MFENDRVEAVRRLLADHVASPSQRHIRDPVMLGRLAAQIVKAVDRQNPIWAKWDAPREAVLRAAARCWIPPQELRDFLNTLPGPQLTETDLAQRLRAIHEEPYESYPDDELKDGCLSLYACEKAQGAEMPAIIGALQDYVEQETERRRRARQDAWQRQKEEERLALEARFLAGADCKWTPLNKSAELYTRKNGRAYCLKPAKDKRWELFRMGPVGGLHIRLGVYGSRGEASKALAKLPYEPEPRW